MKSLSSGPCGQNGGIEDMMREELWNNENWVTSEHNFADDVRKGFHFAEGIQFHDATLRDGEQSVGLVFRKHEKVAIAKMLDEIGIDRIEAGMPAVSKEDAEAIKEIKSMGLRSKIIAFSRAAEADIDRALECEVDGVILEVPSAEIRFVNQFKWTEQQVIEKALRGVGYAKEKGLFVNFFPYDTTRAKLPFLERLITAVTKSTPPDSITLVDTTSCALPSTIKKIYSFMRNTTDLPLEVHTHNDFGLGVANALAGLEAGANVVHGCMLGLGERCGNAAMEEIAICLKTLYGVDIRLRFDKIYEVCSEIARMGKVRIGFNKPFVGDVPFIRETGLGADVLLRKPTTVFALNPKFIGRDFTIVLGKKSGKASIKLKLDEIGVAASEAQVSEILERVKLRGIEKKGLVTMDEFKEIVDKVKGTHGL
jgi:methanogen homocitrate synthase